MTYHRHAPLHTYIPTLSINIGISINTQALGLLFRKLDADGSGYGASCAHQEGDRTPDRSLGTAACTAAERRGLQRRVSGAEIQWSCALLWQSTSRS